MKFSCFSHPSKNIVVISDTPNKNVPVQLTIRTTFILGNCRSHLRMKSRFCAPVLSLEDQIKDSTSTIYRDSKYEFAKVKKKHAAAQSPHPARVN